MGLRGEGFFIPPGSALSPGSPGTEKCAPAERLPSKVALHWPDAWLCPGFTQK